MSVLRLTAADIVFHINGLPRGKIYHYLNESNRGEIVVDEIVLPEGPIYIKRWNSSSGETIKDARRVSISTEMIARIANAFVEGQPINFDRVLGASYNTRAVLEALLAHTPQFWACKPGRIDSYTGEIKAGHKHLVWCPNDPHPALEIHWKEIDIAISERTVVATYDVLTLPDDLVAGKLDIDIKRRHTQIQVALVRIGTHLNYRSWIAKEDRGFKIGDKRLSELEGVIDRLEDEPMIGPFGAVSAARSIDCIWFRNSKNIQAIMEIEHSTNVISGLDRMEGLKDVLPAINTRYVIVADDLDREEVVRKANLDRFTHLDIRYFSYSAVHELYELCQHRNITGRVALDFIDAYMEPVVTK